MDFNSIFPNININDHEEYPWLDDMYNYLINSRVYMFGDSRDYVAVVEHIGYNPRAGDCRSSLYYFGTAFKKKLPKPYSTRLNVTDIVLVEAKHIYEIQDREKEIIQKNTETIIIRNKSTKIEKDINKYNRKSIIGIGVAENDEIDVVMFFRYLTETQPELLWATEEEVRARLTRDLPLIGIVNDFYYEDIVAGDPPIKFKDSDLYRNIQRVSKSLNIKDWKNKKPANNHWRDWPDAGSF